MKMRTFFAGCLVDGRHIGFWIFCCELPPLLMSTQVFVRVYRSSEAPLFQGFRKVKATAPVLCLVLYSKLLGKLQG